MKYYLFIFIFLVVSKSYCEDEWLKTVSSRTDKEAVEWLKSLLQDKLNEEGVSKSSKPIETSTKKKCQVSNEINSAPLSPDVYVFLSFSVSDQTWLTLSHEMQKVNAVIVLRGIPNNSFKELSNKIQKLSKSGFSASIQINPKLFEEFNIESVPSFVIVDGDKNDKVSGNVHLTYAIELMARNGETQKAKQLLLNRGNK